MRNWAIALLLLLAALPVVAFIGDTSPGAGVSSPPPATGTYAYNSFSPPNTPGFSYTDPVFGETVRRLTTDHKCDDIYARNMWWSADDARYLHIATDGENAFWNVIDVATGAVTHTGIPFGIITGDGGFDPVDQNTLYYYGTDGIHKVVLGVGGSWSEPQPNPYWTPPQGPLRALGGTLNWLDASGRYMMVRYGPEPSVHLYDRSNMGLGPYANPIDYTPYNYLGLTPDGQFIVGYTDPVTDPPERGVSWRIDHAARAVAPSRKVFWSLCGGHGSFVSASDGRNYMVVGACNGVEQSLWRADIEHEVTGLDEEDQKSLPGNMRLLNKFGPDSSHMATMTGGDWAFISNTDFGDTFNSGTADANGNITPWHPYRQEILAINVLTGEIRRLAHHRSRFFPGQGDYCSQPRVSVSWNGKVVGFASNYNQTVGSTPVVDIYAIPFNPGTPPPPSGLVAHWPLDEGSGLSTADVTGNGHTGDLVNGPSWVVGRSGQGLSFDGLDDHVEVDHAADLNAFPLTVAAWVRTTSTGAGVVNKYAASSFSGYNVFFDGGQLCAWYFRDASNHTWDGSGCPLAVSGANDGQWHHVAYVVDASGGRLYLDGVLRTTRAWTGTPGPTTTLQPLSLARYPGAGPASYLAGTLDDARVYDRALTAAEIAALAQ